MRQPAQGATSGWVMAWVLYSSGVLCVSSTHCLILPRVSSSPGSWSQYSHSKDSGLDLWSGAKIP